MFKIFGEKLSSKPKKTSEFVISRDFIQSRLPTDSAKSVVPKKTNSSYDFLFNCDETYLAGGSGSDLLDQFLIVPPERRSDDANLHALPQFLAILEANPAVRGDIFARICILVCASSSHTTDNIWRLPRNYHSLSVLLKHLERDPDKSLASSAAFAIMRQSTDMAAGQFLPIETRFDASLLACRSAQFIQMVIKAQERTLDRGFETLLMILITRMATQCVDLDMQELRACKHFIHLSLTCLKRSPEDFAPLRELESALVQVGRLVTQWKTQLPTALWNYLNAFITPQAAPSQADQWALLQNILSQTPGQRGEIIEHLWRLTRQLRQKIPRSRWSYAQLLSVMAAAMDDDWSSLDAPALVLLWQEITARRSVLSSIVVVDLVTSLSAHEWPESLAFARSVAKALPRTSEAKQALIQRFSQDIETLPQFPQFFLAQQKIILDTFVEPTAPENAAGSANVSTRGDDRDLARHQKAAISSFLTLYHETLEAEASHLRRLHADLMELISISLRLAARNERLRPANNEKLDRRGRAEAKFIEEQFRLIGFNKAVFNPDVAVLDKRAQAIAALHANTLGLALPERFLNAKMLSEEDIVAGRRNYLHELQARIALKNHCLPEDMRAGLARCFQLQALAHEAVKFAPMPAEIESRLKVLDLLVDGLISESAARLEGDADNLSEPQALLIAYTERWRSAMQATLELDQRLAPLTSMQRKVYLEADAIVLPFGNSALTAT